MAEDYTGRIILERRSDPLPFLFSIGRRVSAILVHCQGKYDKYEGVILSDPLRRGAKNLRVRAKSGGAIGDSSSLRSSE